MAKHWADLGTFWQMERQYVKPYPICRWAHAPIDAVRQVMGDHQLTQGDIASVHINTFHESACLFPGIPTTTSQAQYSLAYAVATQMAYGRIGVEHITGDGLNDPLVAGIHKRISVSEDKRHSDRFPTCRVADVTVTLRNNQVIVSGDVHARGGPEAPMARAEVIEKFMAFAAPSLGDTRAAAIRDVVLGFVDADSKVSDLTALIFDAP